MSQAQEALKEANRIRLYRCNLKRQIKAANGTAREITAHTVRFPLYEAEGMKVEDLLLALPKVGSYKVRSLLRAADVNGQRKLGHLTPREREALVGVLEA